jgi:DNA end-binding protein Ku
MASTVWKGYISFGLISVPIRLYVAAREQHIGFNQIHASCGTRIKQQLYCPTDERVVERNEIVKGYPAQDGTYLIISSEELKALEAASSETMAIVQFVKLADVDPIYYESSYYTVAEEPGRRAYALLMQGMQRLNLGAVAKITLHQREQIVLIRPYSKGLVLHTLYYPEEVREVAEFGANEDVSVQPQEVTLAEQFMQQLAGEFHPEQFTNEYEARVEKLIESKSAGEAAPGPEQPPRKMAPVINLMDALRKSIQQREGSAAPPEAEPERKAPSKTASKSEDKPKRRRAG